MSNVEPNIGVMFSFRNPAQWRRPFVDVYRDELDTIAEAESLGFDTVWLTEHHFCDDGYSPSMMALASAVAVRTERVRIGFNLIVLPLHHPLSLAEDIATLDVLSNGRIDIGVGMGSAVREFETFGISMKERLQRFREGLDLLTGLLSNDTFSYDGKHYQVNNARLRPPPVQQPMPPLWIGAGAPPALKRAGKRGANYLGWGIPELQAIYERARLEAGYDVESSKTLVLAWMHVAETDEQAWQEAAPHLHHVLSEYKAIGGPDGSLSDMDIPSVEEMRSKIDSLPFRMAVGSPETVLARLRSLAEGVRTTHFALSTMAGMDPGITRRSLRMFAEQVSTALKAVQRER